MDKKTAVRTREKWVDDVKVIACILVVLGHFFASVQSYASGGVLYEWFHKTIYYFHVPLFFICSGYLYQKYSRVDDIKSYLKNISKKALALGIPYVTFSSATWVLKTVFSRDVNNQIGGFCDTLFQHPTAPYWYLYALFFIFLVTPTFSTVKMTAVGLAVAIVAKGYILTGGGTGIYAVSTVLTNEIWFVLGMSICVFNVQLHRKKKSGALSGLVFVILSIVAYVKAIKPGVFTFILGLIACYSVIILVADNADNETAFGKVMEVLSKYTMPIFLMHTIMAAALRAALLRIGVTNGIIHISVGLIVSFGGPILAAYIMEKTTWLEFFLYPNKVLHSRSRIK
ncbi:acyltransferase family protein [Blautia wexlerae]|uniref:acyltransferase family protein n=1 Tax=Blautia wexlerae TaxID=418240 RepID=UPI0009618042|nr:acyltransferase [Blautia wexlerae]MBT9806963.1 acyltransferase family protein [Blautia wexlerae]OKZ64119.1 MAG: acyltransferase [Clostridiales bacterium 41_12_two_minus]